MTPRPLVRLMLVLVLGAALVACGETPGDVLPDPRDGRSGLELTGQVRGRQLALSDGLPTINFTDCDVNQGRDTDFCIITRDISGETIVLIVENPELLVEGETVPVADVPCRQRLDCDEVTEALIVDLQLGAGTDRIRATGGEVSVEVVVPMQRYRGDLDLRLPGGDRVRGTFDVVPRPEELSWNPAG